MPITLCKICDNDDCICHVKVCNCARCRAPLTSDADAVGREINEEGRAFFLQPLAGHYDDRPYCLRCLPAERCEDEVAMRFWNYRTARQRAAWDHTTC